VSGSNPNLPTASLPGLPWQDPVGRLRVAVVGTFVDFYRRIADVSEEKYRLFEAARLQLSCRAEVISADWITTESDASAVNKKLKESSPDVLILIPLVAVFGGLSAGVVRDLQCPVIIWNLQPDLRVSPDYDLVTLIRNSGSLGVSALANTMTRSGQPFRVLVSCGQDAAFDEEMRRLLAELHTAHVLRKAKIGIVGSIFSQMADITLDTRSFEQEFGVKFVTVSKDELTARVRAVSREEVEGARVELNSRFETDSIHPDEIDRSLRLHVAFSQIARQFRLSACAINCHGENCLQNDEIGVTACYAASLLTTAGCPVSCTGDLPTAIALLVLKALTGVSQYVEIDFVDFENDSLLLANGGEGDLNLAVSTPHVVGNQNFSGLHGRGASFDFCPKEGSATLLSYTPTHGNSKGRFVLAEGEVTPLSLNRLRLYHQRFRFSHSSAREGFERWCEAGAVHHASLCLGHWSQELNRVGKTMGIEVLSI
jgi:L-arabinose isomerase